MRQLFDFTSFESAKTITKAYSTSFSLGIKVLHRRFHYPIYAIYGFVRYADEIVDTFHDHDKAQLLKEFKAETYQAIGRGISLNPVLNAFQAVVNQYNIDHSSIEAFLHSMEMDLDKSAYNPAGYEEYIYGSAEVVGLMCLRVFCEGNEEQYQRLLPHGRSLGAAFQKVNFLRDMKSDFVDRGRVYFPGVDFDQFDEAAKATIEADVTKDFEHAYQGIIQLPKGARLGVYLAYVYYGKLFRKIQRSTAAALRQERLRIPDGRKFTLLITTYFRHQFGNLSKA